MFVMSWNSCYLQCNSWMVPTTSSMCASQRGYTPWM